MNQSRLICRHLFKKGLPDLPKRKFFSINEAALENLYNNPGMRMVNAIYSLLVKIPIEDFDKDNKN